MMNGKNIILSFGGRPIAASVQASISLRQEAEEYSTLPGTVDDDGWARFRPGRLSWGLGNEGFYTDQNEDFVKEEIMYSDSRMGVDVNLDDLIRLEGFAHCEKMSIDFKTGNLSKLKIDLVGDDFLNIKQ